MVAEVTLTSDSEVLLDNLAHRNPSVEQLFSSLITDTGDKGSLFPHQS
jgi:hypothetical protein